MRLVQFGEVLLPQMNGQQQLPVSFRSAVVPLRGGGFDQDGAASYLEPKVITASFWVRAEGDDSIDDIINALYKEATKGRRLLLSRLRNDVMWQTEAKFISATETADSRVYLTDAVNAGAGYTRMQVSFEIVYPYWLSVDDEQKFFDEGWLMNSGIVFDSGGGTEIITTDLVNEFTIDNDGGAAHQKMSLTIEAETGVTIDNMLIENLTTGEELTWSGTITDTESLVILTLPQSIKLDGVDNYDQTTIPNDQVRFWSLALGENNFRITFDSIAGGNAVITFRWAKHYVR